MLHLRTPRPVLDLANVQLCCRRVRPLARMPRNVVPPFEALRWEALREIRGERSSGELSLCAPSRVGESLKVTVRLTRSPVLGMMRVA